MSAVATKLLALYEQGVIDGEALNASLKPIPAPRVKPTPAPRPAVEQPKPTSAPHVKPTPAPRLKPIPAPCLKPTPDPDVEQPQLTFKQRGHRIKDMLRTWEITIPSGHQLEADPLVALEGLREEIKRKLVEEILALQGVRSRLALDIKLRKDKENGQTEHRRVVLRSNQSTILQAHEIDEELNKAFPTILGRLEAFTNEGSGWVVERVEVLMLVIARYRPIRGGSYIPLPKEIQVKRAVVNVKNRDDDCLRWSLRAALFPAARDTERPGKYPTDDGLDFEGINAPTPIDQIERVEKQNNLALNVFGWDCREVVVYRLSKQPGNIRRIHLLLVRNGEQYHYTWIKNFNRLLHNQSKHERRKHFCERCLHCYSREDLLEEHKPNCRGIWGTNCAHRDAKRRREQAYLSELAQAAPRPLCDLC